MPGSHVLIHTEGDVPESTLMQAAMLAAYYSKGVRSAQVPIDATLRRYIKNRAEPPPVLSPTPTRERCISPRAKRKSRKLSFCANKFSEKKKGVAADANHPQQCPFAQGNIKCRPPRAALGAIHTFPRQIDVRSAEMAERGRLTINRAAQIQHVDDASRTKDQTAL